MDECNSRRNYFRLLIALGVLGAFYPLLDLEGVIDLPSQQRMNVRSLGLIVWTGAFWGVLYVAARSIRCGRRALRVAFVLMVLAFGLGLAALFVGTGDDRDVFGSGVHAAARLFGLLFLFQATFTVLLDVVAVGRVDANKMWGAVCVYILLALSWAHVFALLEVVLPGSLVMVPGTPAAPIEKDGLSLMLYYSFTTMTTLGTGDVVPGNPVARLFAGVEAVMGQLYLAVIVARLVGLHITHSHSALDEQS